MGETAPPQAPGGSLGIGVAGAGLLGGGPVTPRIHSAIVERLRARIAVCRQHHLNCEGRYERSRAETSDRERENTLQLLTLVQHGQVNRKSKHSKSTCAPPPDYHHHQQQQQHLRNSDSKEIAGNQHQSTNGLDQRNSALIALQGSLKRRLVVNVANAHSKRPNGIPENSFLDFKKLRNEHLSVGQNGYQNVNGLSQALSADSSMDHSLPRNTSNSNCNSNDLFNFALSNIKKEPGETMSCSKHIDVPISNENHYKYADEFGEQLMDPDLQELFSELTNISVPPMSDTELQNMINITIKQDEPFNIDLGHQPQRAIPSSLPLDKVVIKSEYSSCLNPTRVSSPLLRPSSTGPVYSMNSSSLMPSPNTTVQQNPSQSQMSNVTSHLNNWQELSHAQQLKQIAANRQQTLIQHHQPNQPLNWPNMSPVGPSSRPFRDEKASSPFRQLSPHNPQTNTLPTNGAQTKMLNSCLYKKNPSSQNNCSEQIKSQDSNKSPLNSGHPTQEPVHSCTKPVFYFSPNQQMTSVHSTQSKGMLQYAPQQTTSQQHEPPQQVQTASSQSLSRPATFQQKMTFQKTQQNQPGPGLHYPPVSQHQEQHSTTASGTSSTSTSCASPNNNNGYGSQQPLSAQQMMEKTNALQRQMIEQKQQHLLQQQIAAGIEKTTSQDHLNHMNRPPPDYKDQRRNSVGVQQTSQYSNGPKQVGFASNAPTTNPVSTHSGTTQKPSQPSTSHGSMVTTLQGVQNIYGSSPRSQQTLYTMNNVPSQIQQQPAPNAMENNPNSHVLPRQSPNGQGNTLPPFATGSGVQPSQFRPSINHGTNMEGQRPCSSMINPLVSQNWPTHEVKNQSGLCFSNNSQFSNQSVQGILGNQHFTQSPSTQPEVQLRSQINQSIGGPKSESVRGFTTGQPPLRSQPSPNHNQVGGSTTSTANTFTSTNQMSRPFSSSDTSNDLGTFDFLSPNNSGLESSLISDPDFIDTFLKTGPANDDWIKDIILDEIFKSQP
ncbi:hypothetical protein GDO86_004711 [Hymenochirus boettgeri]|uniref:Neurogenic mastermind-like N-terminal domain-containing protein n=1 Tax=Hymenochirus boettgeri TaxID=247094 RepID=A0A8T2KEE3_9PIPI|nr:hypothetical protein GDO86_004711 [Hymenochirus boettgeri]